MSANMDTVTDVRTAEILTEYGWISVMCKHFNNDWADRSKIEELPEVLAHTDNFSLSCGTSQKDIDLLFDAAVNIKDRFGKEPKIVTIDIANGYLDMMLGACQKIREKLPDVVLVAGNVVTPEGMYDLVYKGGVDVVKVGIGSGAVCTTRLKTGVGYPQFSAVSECAAAALNCEAHVISDGGCIHPGDVSKAFGARSSFVMLGSMLAAHEQSPGQSFTDEDGKEYKEYYGMSSTTA